MDPEGCRQPQADASRINDLFDGTGADVACHKISRGHLEGGGHRLKIRPATLLNTLYAVSYATIVVQEQLGLPVKLP